MIVLLRGTKPCPNLRRVTARDHVVPRIEYLVDLFGGIPFHPPVCEAEEEKGRVQGEILIRRPLVYLCSRHARYSSLNWERTPTLCSRRSVRLATGFPLIPDLVSPSEHKHVHAYLFPTGMMVASCLRSRR